MAKANERTVTLPLGDAADVCHLAIMAVERLDQRAPYNQRVTAAVERVKDIVGAALKQANAEMKAQIEGTAEPNAKRPRRIVRS